MKGYTKKVGLRQWVECQWCDHEYECCYVCGTGGYVPEWYPDYHRALLDALDAQGPQRIAPLAPEPCECVICNPLVKAREKTGKTCPVTGLGFIGPLKEDQ